MVALALAFAACSSSSGPSDDSTALPSAPALLQRSAQQMKTVRSARFDLRVNGTIAGVAVKKAVGIITSDGKASGTVDIEEGGSLVEIDLIVANGTIYVKGPTGTYLPLPSGLTGGLFDPSKILSPTGGLSALLESAKDGKTVREEKVGGVDTYRVTAILDANLLGKLMPLPSAQSVPGTLWIGKDTPYLYRITVDTTQPGEQNPTELTLTLSGFGVPADITPPS